MIYVRGAAWTPLIAALEFAGRPCEVIGIEQFDVTREQIAAVLEFVADHRRSDVPPVRLLFDHGHPERFGASAVRSHGAHGAVQRWHRLRNGELLSAGERARFDLLLTTDRRIRHRQNLRVGRIALVLLTGSTKGRLVQQHVDRIALAVASATPWQLRRGRDSVPGEVVNLVRFTFAVGHATGRKLL